MLTVNLPNYVETAYLDYVKPSIFQIIWNCIFSRLCDNVYFLYYVELFIFHIMQN